MVMEIPLEATSSRKYTEKFCSTCKTMVDVVDFHKHSSTADKLQYVCKDCVSLNDKKRYKHYSMNAKNKGLCNSYGCKNSSFKNGRLCESHFFKNAAINRLGSSDFADDLMRLAEKQQYKCALTGDHLTPTDNMSLDHIKPASKFPELKEDISNVQWVTKWANAAKWNLSQEEFYEQCKKANQYKNQKSCT
jgi:hypothetical protein|tara:strand:- start:828 stop:1400 length:573 start_codon:yes stop_codon:yes gene_type:complete